MPKGIKSKRKMNELRKKEFLSSETVTIFRYFETPDLHSSHTSTYYDINTQTGELTETDIEDRDIFIRPGSRSVYKRSITYDQLYRSLKFYHAENLDIYLQLNQDNFREWLDENWEIYRDY